MKLHTFISSYKILFLKKQNKTTVGTNGLTAFPACISWSDTASGFNDNNLCVKTHIFFSFTVTHYSLPKPADATLKSLLRLIRALEGAFSLQIINKTFAEWFEKIIKALKCLFSDGW